MSKKTLLLSLTCSAEIIASNVDLLTQILLRVPAKSLIRFKSLSKQWLSLISDSQFARNHTQENPSPPISGLYFYSNRDSSLSLNDQITHVSFRDDHRWTTLPNFSFLDGSGAQVLVLHHSFNGLMLCSNGDQTYLVCNPTTQKFVVLPTLAAAVSEPKFRYLIYDPRKSNYYKVVVVRSSYYKNTSQFDVYSSESDSWKSTVAAPCILNHWSGNWAVWNGAIFRMSCVLGLESCCSKHDHVYYRFDIDAEKLTTFRVPSPDTNLSKEILCFKERGGHLFQIQVPYNKATEIRVLEMMDRENDFRWTVKYIIDLTPLILPQGRGCILPERSGCRFLVISIMNVGASENDLAVVLYIRGELVQYNIESKSWKVLSDLPLGRNFPACISNDPMYSYQFIQSLTPI